jgi:2-methylcitrate dehydratase PrpD
MLGAAAAVARLSGLEAEPTRVVLGLAASMSGGLMQNFGTMAKPFHSGRAAECAIVAVDLVQRGFTASNVILEAPRGFFRALGGGCEEARLRGKLGRPWSFADRGVWLKPFPTGSLAHPAMSGLLRLLNDHDIKPQQVAKIRVRTSRNIHETLLHHRPKSELEAKFSLEFCMASLLLERRCGLNQFNDEYVNRPDVQRAIALVDYQGFDETQARDGGYNIVTSFIEIELADGRTVKTRADHGKGNIADPMSEAEVAAKFRDCAEFARWPAAKATRAIDLILHLDQLADVRELTACVSV